MITFYSCSLTVNDTNITDCSAGYDYGAGGIFSYGLSIALSNCAIRNCSTNRGGGGIHRMWRDSKTFSVSDCLFHNNTKSKYGGCNLYGPRSSLPQLIDCLFSNNNNGSYSSSSSMSQGNYIHIAGYGSSSAPSSSFLSSCGSNSPKPKCFIGGNYQRSFDSYWGTFEADTSDGDGDGGSFIWIVIVVVVVVVVGAIVVIIIICVVNSSNRNRWKCFVQLPGSGREKEWDRQPVIPYDH